jgi:hypothetical protein
MSAGASSVSVPVALPLDVSKDSALVHGILDALEERGMIVPARTAPLGIGELMEETGLSDTMLYRMIEDGVFERCPGVGKVLVTAGSVRRWQGFGESGKGGAK